MPSKSKPKLKKRAVKLNTVRASECLLLNRYPSCVIERTEWKIPRTHISKDLWGFCDLLCLTQCSGRNGFCQILPGFVAIQTTSKSNRSARIKKIKAEPRAKAFLLAGGRILVHGWAVAKDGSLNPNEVELTLEDLK